MELRDFLSFGQILISALLIVLVLLQVRGTGFGVSTVTPLGPLGIDYAYGLDRRDELGRPDPKWQLHFRLGQIF